MRRTSLAFVALVTALAAPVEAQETAPDESTMAPSMEAAPSMAAPSMAAPSMAAPSMAAAMDEEAPAAMTAPAAMGGTTTGGTTAPTTMGATTAPTTMTAPRTTATETAPTPAAMEPVTAEPAMAPVVAPSPTSDPAATPVEDLLEGIEDDDEGLLAPDENLELQTGEVTETPGLELEHDALQAIDPEHEEHLEEEMAHGEGGHHEVLFKDFISFEQNKNLYGAAFNFILLIVLLVFLFRKPLRRFLSNRRREIEEGLADAERRMAEAEAKYTEYASRLERLDAELEKIRKDMVKAGEEERDRIVAEAERKAARMRRDAEFLIEQQMKQLREDLTKEAVETAIRTAEAVLTEKTTAEDRSRLADTYLDTLSQVAKEKHA